MKWYNLISLSPRIRKLRFVIKENWGEEFYVRFVKNSKRTYDEVKVERLLRQRDQVFQMFAIFSDHLVTIDTIFDFDMKGIHLPALKNLIIRPESAFQFFEDGLLGSVTNLEKLHIGNSCNFPQKIVECLRANPNLVELYLEDHVAQEVFGCDESFDDIKLALKVFKSNCLHLPKKSEKPFLAFIFSQRDSLEEIKALKCCFNIFQEIYYGLPKLRRITYSQSYYQAPHAFSSMDRTKVEEMNLVITSVDVFRALVRGAPELTKLYMGEATVQKIHWACNNAPLLKEISYGYTLEKSDESFISHMLDGIQKQREVVIKQI